jgi:uncharacterized membrane protein YqjE
MSDAPRESRAPVGATGRVAASLLEGLHLRFELLALELGQERDRLIEGVVLCLVIALAAFMLLLCANLALLVLFWDAYRVEVVVGLVAFYAGVLLVSMLWLRRHRAAGEEPFAASRQVLEQDMASAESLGDSLS